MQSFDMKTAVDVVIAITLLECAALALHRRLTGAGMALRDIALNMASGLALMLALRSALSDAHAAWILACLLAAGLAHGADITLRWRRSAQPDSTPTGVTA